MVSRQRLPLSPSGDAPNAGRATYALLAVGLVLLGIAGYLGYLTYPRFDLPSVAGAGLLLLAAGAGVASFFSPCSFPLLATLLSREIRSTEAGRARTRATITFAAAFSAGAVSFLVILGILVGLGGRGLVGSVTFTSAIGIALRIVVGVLLILLGLIQAEVIPVTFHGVERVSRPAMERLAGLRRRHPVGGFAAFGFSYFLIAFG